MLLDRTTFVDVRADTHALFLYDLGLYYHYTRALLSEFITEVDTLRAADLGAETEHVNTMLRRIRRTHSNRGGLIVAEASGILQEQGLDASALEHTFRTGKAYITGHSQTDRTQTCPLTVDSVARSRVSSTREATNVRSDLRNISLSAPAYVSADLVARLLGGQVQGRTLVASGTDMEGLQAYMGSFTDTQPVQLDVTYPDRTESFALDATGGALLDEPIEAWCAFRAHVQLAEQGIGTSGPMFEYPLTTRMVDTTLRLRQGMCLESDTSSMVTRVAGERVTLSAPNSFFGERVFVYKACLLWAAYLPSLADIHVVGDTVEQREASFLAQTRARMKTCSTLLASIPVTTNPLRFDIRAAHHAVGADYAYNLLERGRLIEYHQLSEQEASRANVMSMAASHIRAGTRL